MGEPLALPVDLQPGRVYATPASPFVGHLQEMVGFSRPQGLWFKPGSESAKKEEEGGRVSV